MNNEEADQGDLLTAAEAADLLGVARSTILNHEKRKRLKPVKELVEGMRRRPLFRRVDVEALRRPEQPPAADV